MGFRKIKLFKFSNFESYEACQESANDYWSEIFQYNIESDVILTNDFIAVVLPSKQGLKSVDILASMNRNISKLKPEAKTDWREIL